MAQRQRGLERKKQFIIEKGGRCNICGYNKNLSSLCFHHVEPSLKSFPLDFKNFGNRKLSALKEEAKKCRLLCHNCHFELHNPDLILTDEDIVRYKPDLLEKITLARPKTAEKPPQLKLEECVKKDCTNKVKDHKRKYCSNTCRGQEGRKTERPSKERLKELIKDNSFCALGRMFDVSDNAIRKWAKAYDLL